MDLTWSGKKSFNSATDSAWLYGEKGVDGGLVRSAKASSGTGSLTFLQVYEAGHMVPMDQPEAALDMLNTFLQNKPF